MKEKEHRFEYIHSLTTFQVSDNELYLRGTDNQGNEITLIFPCPEFLEMVDYEYIREKVIEHFTNLNKPSDD